jgi:hypothetical protein
MPSSPAPHRPLVLRGVSVVSTADGTHGPAVDVSVRDGVITAISASSSGPADPFAVVVDAPGRFVVPGYVDAHAHPLPASGPIPASALGLMLANGITGFRQMSGSAGLLARRRAGTLGLPADAPDLLALPGALLTPMNAGSSAAAIAAARSGFRSIEHLGPGSRCSSAAPATSTGWARPSPRPSPASRSPRSGFPFPPG